MRRPKQCAQRKGKRRAVLDGYPIEAGPLSAAEVDAYFENEKIICLFCGKEFDVLSKHLSRIHETTPDEYRTIYGLPWTMGLLSPRSRGNFAAAVMSDGRFEKMSAAAYLGVKPRKNPIQPFAREKLAVRASNRMRYFHAWSRMQGGEDGEQT